MSDSDLGINCCLLGDEYNNMFHVKIPRNQLIDTLRDAIKARGTTMKDIDANSLILYKVSILLTPELAGVVAELGPDGVWLNPARTLSEAFDDGLLYGHVHVVIKTPGVWKCSSRYWY